MPHLFLRGVRLTPTPIQAVLFDKDGTMSHSEPMLEALAAARVERCLALAEEHGLPSGALPQLLDLLQRGYGLSPDGLRPDGSLAVASRLHNLIITATSLAQVGFGWPEALAVSDAAFRQTDDLHGQGSRFQPRTTPGLAALLDSFQAVGLRCAVISNDHRQGIQGFLASHDLSSRIEAIWSAEDHPCKPDPGAVFALCAVLGVEPCRCALIGDANSDLRMARAAGVAAVVGYRSGWRQPPPLDADFPLLDHWDELQAIV